MNQDFYSIISGNTHLSIAHWQNQKLNKLVKPDEVLNSPSAHLICESKPRNKQLTSIFGSLNKLPSLENNQYFGMDVHYNKTLGPDRLICARFLYEKMQHQNIAFLDFGTFLTINFISKTEGFLGGYIVPGTEAYFQGYDRSKALSDLRPKSFVNESCSSPYPQSSKDSMMFSYQFVLEGLTQFLTSKQIEKVYLTGANSKLLECRFAELDHETDDLLQHRSITWFFYQFLAKK